MPGNSRETREFFLQIWLILEFNFILILCNRTNFKYFGTFTAPNDGGAPDIWQVCPNGQSAHGFDSDQNL